MPHIVIEYSDNLKQQIKESGITKAVHQTVLDSGLFSPESVKARSVSYSDFVLPEGSENFAHIMIALFAGRTAGQKANLSNTVFNTARQKLPDCDKLSVEIRDVDGDSYRK